MMKARNLSVFCCKSEALSTSFSCEEKENSNHLLYVMQFHVSFFRKLLGFFRLPAGELTC